jgi:hypothetical protein
MRKWPIGAIAVAAVTIVAVVLPFVTDSGCGSSGPDLSVSEPMELRGRWLGLRLAPADSPSAAEMGVPPTVLGVVVVEVAEGANSRARQAGVNPGDVIIGVEGDATGNLADLYSLSADLDVARPLTLDVMRRGQAMRLVLPPLYGGTTQQPMPAGTVQPVAGAVPQMGGAAVGTQVGLMQYQCPLSGTRWSHAQVAPHFTCPRCGRGLVR